MAGMLVPGETFPVILDEGHFFDLSREYDGGHPHEVFGQRVYLVHHRPGKRMSLPFPAGDFNALVYLASPQPAEVEGTVGLSLLRHGMRSAVVGGCQADRMSETCDALVDEHGFSPCGETVYHLSLEGESVEDCVSYALTPNGLADVLLVMVVGDDIDFQQVAQPLRMMVESGAAGALPADAVRA